MITVKAQTTPSSKTERRSAGSRQFKIKSIQELDRQSNPFSFLVGSGFFIHGDTDSRRTLANHLQSRTAFVGRPQKTSRLSPSFASADWYLGVQMGGAKVPWTIHSSLRSIHRGLRRMIGARFSGRMMVLRFRRGKKAVGLFRSKRTELGQAGTAHNSFQDVARYPREGPLLARFSSKWKL